MSKFLTAPDLKILASLTVHDSLYAIAAELNLTPSTVQVSIERMRQNFNAANNHALIAKVIRFGLVSLELRNRSNLTLANEKLLSILDLPNRFTDGFDEDLARDLLRKTIYYRHCRLIDEFLLERALCMHPAYIQAWKKWQSYAHDGDSWYMHMARNDEFQVGLRKGKSRRCAYIYTTETKACAVFIKRELERIKCL